MGFATTDDRTESREDGCGRSAHCLLSLVGLSIDFHPVIDLAAARRRLSKRAVASLATLGLAACGEAPVVDDPWGGTIEVREGITWVTNPKEPLWREDTPAFVLKLEQTFGVDETGPEEALPRAISGAAVDGDGNVYAVDVADNRLVSYAPDGTFRWTRSKQGQGPGDMAYPRRVTWDGAAHLYADNQNGGRIDRWTLGGEYVDTQPLVDFDIVQGYVVGMPDGDTLVVAERIAGRDGVRLRVFDVSGDEWQLSAQVDAAGGRDQTPESFGGWKTSARVAGDKIFAGHAIEYRLQRFDLDGNLEAVWQRPFPPLLAPITYRGTGTIFGQYDAPLRLDSGRFLVHHIRAEGIADHDEFRRQWDEFLERGVNEDFRHWTGQLDLLDAEGRYVGSIDFEPREELLTLGPNGRLYTGSFVPEPSIRRYEIIVSEPTP